MSGTETRYRLERRIATGGMGEVWRGTDAVLGREVAVKVLKPEYADDPTFRSRFEAEARHAAALSHPNIASVFDFGELPAEDGSGVPRPYLVMELVPGQPLSDLLRGGEPMPPQTAADLVAQAADAVAAAHALGIVHRDLKPGNLLVTPDRQVKITDFGIARAADGTQLTQTGQVIGTPAYLSPEQAEGKPATMASDVYALGVVLYECLAGRRPFTGDTPVATALAHLREQPPPLPETVPGPLREVVATALAKDPAHRFASMEAFATALRGGPVTSAAAAGAAGAAAATEALQAPGPDRTRVLTGPLPVPGAGPAGPDRRRELPAWWPWAAGAAAVLVAVLLLSWLVGGEDLAGRTRAPEATTEPTPTRTSPPASPTRAPGITLDPDDYLGLDKDEAKEGLEALGLKVREEKTANPGDQEEDTVADLFPTRGLDEGDEVTLVLWDEPEEEHGDEGEDKGEDKPGKGKGKGKGPR